MSLRLDPDVLRRRAEAARQEAAKWDADSPWLASMRRNDAKHLETLADRLPCPVTLYSDAELESKPFKSVMTGPVPWRADDEFPDLMVRREPSFAHALTRYRK